MLLELWQNDGMLCKKNTEVEVLPVVDLFKDLARSVFFVGGATQVCHAIRIIRYRDVSNETSNVHLFLLFVVCCCCCLHIKPFFLPNDISSTPSVLLDSS